MGETPSLPVLRAAYVMYRSLDLGQMMDEYSGGDVDQHHQQKSQQGSSKNRLKGGVLPAYCDPPNPCPKGYTAEDGCIEMDDFQNKAEFSRKYQASQSCMCDSEHMFSCPDIYHQVRGSIHRARTNLDPSGGRHAALRNV